MIEKFSKSHSNTITQQPQIAQISTRSGVDVGSKNISIGAKDECMQILLDFAPNVLKALKRDAPGYKIAAHEIEAVYKHYLHYKFFKKYDRGISQLEGQIHTLKLYSMDDFTLERSVVADYTGSGIRI